jgi:NADPH-dependent 2,4-dienoyl-CoA reductase/sulfur reductase-like enzyme
MTLQGTVGVLHPSYMQYFESKGITFHMQSKVEKIIPAEGNPSIVGGVVVNGQTIPADFVIMAVGVSPTTEFLQGTAIKLEKDGGIKVDEYLKVEGLKDVYAIGENSVNTPQHTIH